jgi:ABC-type phosphate transport system permease subunit
MASTAFSTARTAPPGHALGETIFRFACAAAATLLLAALAGVVISLFVGGLPAFRQFGFGFLTTTTWNPVTEVYGAAGPIVGTLITAFLALLVALPLALGVSIFLVEFCPVKLSRPIAIAVELLAGIPSIVYGMWGLFVLAPWFAKHIQLPIAMSAEPGSWLDTIFAGTPNGANIFTASIILAIMILPYMAAVFRELFMTVPQQVREAAYGLGCTPYRGDPFGGDPLCPPRHDRRDHARSRPRARRDDGGDLHHRQFARLSALDVRQRLDDRFDHRQRVRRGDERHAQLRADRARLPAVRHHLCGAGHRPPAPARGEALMSRASRRRIANKVFITLCGIATVIALGALFLILWTLFSKGFGGLDMMIFTHDQPAPGSTGGLRNAIVGSIIMCAIGMTIALVVGILAGTWLAEYRRGTRYGHGPLPQRRPALGPVDPDRPVRLRILVAALPRLLRLGGRRGARHPRHADRRAHDRGHTEPAAGRAARGRHGARRQPGLRDHPQDHLEGGAHRPAHRRPARLRAHLAARPRPALHRLEQSILQPNPSQPMASLPTTIFQFALSAL